MAQTAELEMLVRAKNEAQGVLNNVKGDLQQLQKEAKSLKDTLRETGDSLKSAGTKMSVGITAPIIGIGLASIQAAADQEQLQIAMTTMLGSAEKASTLLKELQDFAALTPFESKDVQASAKMLLAYGTAAEDVKNDLTMLGDIASGVGAPLQDLAYLYGTAQASGRVMTADLNQFAGRGIPIIQALADVMGVAKEEVRDMTGEGKVGFDDLKAALQSLSAEGGQFAGLMEAQSTSVSGLWSTVLDNVNITAITVGQTLIETFDLKGKLTGAIEWLTSFAGGLKELAATNPQLLAFGAALGVAAAAAGPLLIALGMMMPALAVLAGPVGLVAAGVAALALAFTTNFMGIRDLVMPVIDGLIEKFGALQALFSKGFSFGDMFGELLAQITGIGIETYDTTDSIRDFLAAMGAGPEVLDAVDRALFELGNVFIPVTEGIKGAGAALKGLWESLNPLLRPFQDLVAAVVQFGPTSTEAQTALAEFGAELNRLTGPLQEFLAPVRDIATQVGNFLAPAFLRVQSALGALPEKFSALTPSFDALKAAGEGLMEKMGPAFADLTAAAQAMWEVVGPILTQFAAFIGAVWTVAVDFGLNAVSAAFEALPGTIQVIIDQVTAIIDLLGTTFSETAGLIKAVVTGDWAGAWEHAKGLVQGFADYFAATGDNLRRLAGIIFNALAKAVTDTLTDMGVDIQGVMSSIQSWWAAKWEDLKSKVQPVIDIVANVKAALEDFRDFITGLSIPNPFAGIQVPEWPSWLPKPPGMALGGLAAGGLTLVGERGPEFVRLQRGDRVYSTAQSQRMAAGWRQREEVPAVTNNYNTVQVDAQLGNEIDIDVLAYQIARKLGIR